MLQLKIKVLYNLTYAYSFSGKNIIEYPIYTKTPSPSSFRLKFAFAAKKSYFLTKIKYTAR